MAATRRIVGNITLAAIAGLALTALGAAPSDAGQKAPTRHERAAHAHLKAHAHPKAGHPTTVALPIGFRPEGITAGRGTTFYVGSVADGRIWAGNVKNDQGRQLLGPVAGRSLRGLLFDQHSGLVWAVGSEGTAGLVLAVDARSGATRAQLSVPDAAFLNDLTLSKGSLWVTDSQVDRLLKIPLTHRGEPVGGYSTLALSGDWPTPAGFRANGIVALPDGTLLLNNSTAGGLYAVNPRTGAAEAIAITGTPAVTSGDGMVLRGNTLFVVRGDGGASVTELKLKATQAGVTAKVVRLLTDDTLDVPSTAALIGDRLWAVNARFGVADPDTQPYWVTGLTLR